VNKVGITYFIVNSKIRFIKIYSIWFQLFLSTFEPLGLLNVFHIDQESVLECFGLLLFRLMMKVEILEQEFLSTECYWCNK
jgi:hypothetical protein